MTDASAARNDGKDGDPAMPGEQAAKPQGGADGAGQPSGTLSYEQARDELASAVRRLEAGGLTLEQSLECWERGEQLAARCAELLEGARARLSAAIAERPGGGGDTRDPDAPF